MLTVGDSTALPKQFTEFHPTNVPLSNQPIDGLTRQSLFRSLQAEQGFSIRPIVRGHRGILLHANGSATPSGLDYAHALRENGASVDAGQRVVITNMIIDKDRIIFELNGGPDHKHRFLRHVEVGTSNSTVPLARDDGTEPVGSRITLAFDKFVPRVTGDQVEQLLSPVIDFAVKSPTQAYVDTLPPKLKQTILDHKVLVGMNREMVLAALGSPGHKSRERDGDRPFEEWIYGEPPQDVEFVRLNGNRVVRVELAKTGQAPVIHAENEMGDYWSTAPQETNQREIHLGDLASGKPDPDKIAPPRPSLRLPGETLPTDPKDDPKDSKSGSDDKDDLTMGPVHFPPKQAPDPTTAPATAPAPGTTPPAQFTATSPSVT
ncbi:MAG TPA: hypothetical protein VGD59_08370 [Acidisarcina sp.]